ncbi:hypothetical protein CONCODRAFT_13300 [Conidiobolus coronatus NRRL 28638]|uniref:Uncharacterized protein n=1 Tax=Conidiobolus coronatus (strain ATCC 28846 / CBS 209.66 / NRRL 28638) TaxID=796925 RepID=A0A137NR52_CONC2|nr:hypothetical protein CONCODRAFT_13300 [Conidiobolus coronatus NRRL 28638]|eukprot:KXN65202.1 hypothetical protein CONCODRAFT_13300 [Conidiobolus coronatus NRRL 28638]
MIDQLNNASPSLISQVPSIAQSVANNQPQASNIVSSVIASASPHPTHHSHGPQDSYSGTATASKSRASTDSLIMSSFIALLPKRNLQKNTPSILDMRVILGVGKLAKHSNYSVQIRLVPRLLQLIALAPYIIYETNFDWKETPHHHDFIRELTSILLEIGRTNSELSQVISNQIWKSYEVWGDNIAQIEAEEFCNQYLPVWIGFLQGLNLSSYHWDDAYLPNLSSRARLVVQSDLVDYIDQAIEQVLSNQTYTLGQHLIQNFKQPPLSSNFMISLYFNNRIIKRSRHFGFRIYECFTLSFN